MSILANEAKRMMSKRNKEIADKLLRKNYPVEEISEITGLSVEDLKKIIN